MTKTTQPAPVATTQGGTKDWPLEIRALLAEVQRPKPSKRHARRHKREPFLFEVSLRVEDRRRPGCELVVHTRDRTESHISLITDAHLEPGQLVDFDFTRLPATAALGRIAGRVRRCRQFREGWFDCVVQIGATARRPLSWWERAVQWVGEATGFGQDDRRGHGQTGRERAA